MSDKGVRDWDLKVAVMKVVLNCYTIGDIVERAYPDDLDLALKTEQKFRTWGETNPTSKASIDFFNRLAIEMDCVPGTTGMMLIKASITRFVNLLASEAKQDIAFEALEAIGFRDDEVLTAGVKVAGIDGVFPAGPRQPPTNYRNIFVPRKGKLETIHTGIHRGRVSEKHYYLTPEAAVTWSELVNADRYPTYDQCKLGLKALVGSPEWDALIGRQPVTAAVILCGGGSPTKDMVLINGLLDQPLPETVVIDYVLLDISPYMLLSSVWWLEEILSTVSGGERINMIPLCEDVRTEFDRSAYDRGEGRTLFAITGGTIGNLSEREFFRQLPAHEGDLLIVSADSLPADDPGNVGSLIAKYNHREMRKFVSPAVHALIRHFDLQETFAKAFERIRVGIAEGELANSDVPGSASVTMTATIEATDVTLLSSTRYVHDELVKFAAGFGWKHVASIPSPSNVNFTQFLFEKSS